MAAGDGKWGEIADVGSPGTEGGEGRHGGDSLGTSGEERALRAGPDGVTVPLEGGDELAQAGGRLEAHDKRVGEAADADDQVDLLGRPLAAFQGVPLGDGDLLDLVVGEAG